jgi:hypothetical protein
MKSCPYCAQTNTKKDEFGYCKKYSCFEVSGDKKAYECLKDKLRDTIFISSYRRNQFDGSPYNPREEAKSWITLKIQELLGFVPMEVFGIVH